MEVRQIEGDLDEYQKIVGGLIQPVDIRKLGCSLFVNEEGIVLNLELNIRANALLWTYAPHHVEWTLLVGNVVLVGMPDENGATTSVPDAVLELIEKIKEADRVR